MKPPDEVRLSLVRQWISKAEVDLSAANILISQNQNLLYAVGFHSQQAAEKYLKSFLTFHQVEFPKTHNLGELLDLVSTVDKTLADSLEEITELNPFGVEIRYPGDLPEPNVAEARKALELAGMAREAILHLVTGK